jgi:hypothetical protein
MRAIVQFPCNGPCKVYGVCGLLVSIGHVIPCSDHLRASFSRRSLGKFPQIYTLKGKH